MGLTQPQRPSGAKGIQLKEIQICMVLTAMAGLNSNPAFLLASIFYYF